MATNTTDENAAGVAEDDWGAAMAEQSASEGASSAADDWGAAMNEQASALQAD